jgi:hypothetical protein
MEKASGGSFARVTRKTDEDEERRGLSGELGRYILSDLGDGTPGRPKADQDLGCGFPVFFALNLVTVRHRRITSSEPRKAAMRSSKVTFNSPSPKSILNSLNSSPPITAPITPTRRFAQRPKPSFLKVTARPASVPAKPPTIIHTMIWPMFIKLDAILSISLRPAKSIQSVGFLQPLGQV